MTYFSGAVAPVPTTRKTAYADHVAAAWRLFRSYGAVRMVETWGVDLPRGKVTDFNGAVNAGQDETVAFSWIEWPDRATADAAWQKMRQDPAAKELPEMPFDGSRMIFGGFAPVCEAGSRDPAGYYQGFLLAVPEANRAPYARMAAEAWQIFEKNGAIGMVEGWGEDVPRGKVTDFYRATKAEAGEVPMFSWVAWPDRATCDAGAKAMEAEMSGMEMPEMPFDGMRMMWAGFEPLFDSATAG